MKILPPVLHRDSYTRLIEEELLSYLRDVLFAPLEDIRLNSVENDALLVAIASGRVWHDGQQWRGQFSVAISKKIREIGGFYSPYGALPAHIQDALRESASKFSTYKVALLGLLATIESNAQTTPEPFSAAPAQIVAKGAAEQFQKSLEGVSDVPVPAGIVEEVAREAVVGLTGAQSTLVSEGVRMLREEVAQATSPASLEDRVKIVSTSLKRRASLSAEQVASQEVADLRESLSKAFGMEEYEWVDAGDHKVRHDHKVLNGRIFRFDNPPVVDTATGRRANPGEDHNCRCFARPIFRK